MNDSSEAKDWSEDQEVQDWFEHVRENLIPMIDESAISMAINPGADGPDPKIAVELGYMILLDKPIVVITRKQAVPPKLRAVADLIVDVDTNDVDFTVKLMEALDELERRGLMR